MEKMKLHTPNLINANVDRVRVLFPDCVTEVKGDNGATTFKIDFDQLRQELSDQIVEGSQERYRLDWPGKREALLAANAPIAKTLRPSRDDSVNFDSTKNLFIEGDNLDALKLLQETYLGQVKVIYIDPPYNTGNDFVYADDFVEGAQAYLEKSNQKDLEGNRLTANLQSNGRFHSDWLSMMYSRLKLTRTLMRDDAMVFISIDENEQAGLKLLCDEVFGRENFVECFVWKKSYGGGPKEKYAVTQHEYVLMYARSKEKLPQFLLPYDPAKIERYYKGRDEHFETRGPFRLKPLEATKSMDARPNLVYSIKLADGRNVSPQRQWLWSKDRVEKALQRNEVIVITNGNSITLNYKQYLRDEDGDERGEKPFSVIDGIFTQRGTNDLSRYFDGNVVVQFPKPVDLIKQFLLVAASGEEGGIILDYFAGSGTTAEAHFALPEEVRAKFRWILVQLPEETPDDSTARNLGFSTVAEVARERIRRAGKTYKDKRDGEEGPADVGFRVLKIDTSNMADVFYAPDATKQDDLLSVIDNIKPGRDNPEDLLFQVLLDWGIDLSLPIRMENIRGKRVLFVNTEPYDLIACFDTGITEELVKDLAGFHPLRAVFRDNGFASDAIKINTDQIFAQLSPGTDVKAI